jgi:bifunctional non-homologous end joining protein LigD
MALEEYQRKRNFDLTAEPPGRVAATATGHSFVVQKHAARRLHYDFRLELDGVLKSWSVPKGPCFDPAAKRLAVAVEDHPIDYGDFEGIIPAGQYGGGTVLLWDRGTWQPVGDAKASLAAGHLKFDLVGEKLRGRWALIRMKPRRVEDDRNWLLVKDRDEHARAESEWSVTDARPESVASGRAMETVAADADRVWHSNRDRPDASKLPGARKAAMPDWVAPGRPTKARKVPDGDEWLHEIEIVGERVLARIDRGHAELWSADRKPRTQALEQLVPAALALPATHAIVDAVATALNSDGRTTNGRSDRPANTLYAIDLLYLDDYDLRKVPLALRKTLLAELVSQASHKSPIMAQKLRYADHVLGRGPETFEHACTLGVPGVVSKKASSTYPPAANAWRFVPCPKNAVPAVARALAPAVAPKANGRGELRIAGVKLTHAERVLYPDVGVTKLALAQFYERVSERMLAYLMDRPLTLVRAPEGMTGQRFYVRHAGDWAPAELRQLDIKDGTGAGVSMIVDDVRGLIALAQMSVLEIHPWNARTRDLERPDRVVFDLDPGPNVAWNEVVACAERVRDVMTTLDLKSFVKTTGGKGLHVVVPLVPAASWTDTLEFSRLIAQGLARFEPARFSADLAKAGRASKVFVDYLRNRRGATSVSAYSTRVSANATVSVPLAWETLGAQTHGDSFHVTDVDRWYTKTDPWADFGKTRQKLTATKIKAAQAAVERAGR